MFKNFEFARAHVEIAAKRLAHKVNITEEDLRKLIRIELQRFRQSRACILMRSLVFLIH